MTRKELLSTVQRYKGAIYVGVLARDDILYVRAVKSDLLGMLSLVGDNQLTARVSCGALYVDNAS